MVAVCMCGGGGDGDGAVSRINYLDDLGSR